MTKPLLPGLLPLADDDPRTVWCPEGEDCRSHGRHRIRALGRDPRFPRVVFHCSRDRGPDSSGWFFSIRIEPGGQPR